MIVALMSMVQTAAVDGKCSESWGRGRGEEWGEEVGPALKKCPDRHGMVVFFSCELWHRKVALQNLRLQNASEMWPFVQKGKKMLVWGVLPARSKIFFSISDKRKPFTSLAIFSLSF